MKFKKGNFQWQIIISSDKNWLFIVTSFLPENLVRRAFSPIMQYFSSEHIPTPLPAGRAVARTTIIIICYNNRRRSYETFNICTFNFIQKPLVSFDRSNHFIPRTSPRNVKFYWHKELKFRESSLNNSTSLYKFDITFNFSDTTPSCKKTKIIFLQRSGTYKLQATIKDFFSQRIKNRRTKVRWS